RGGETAKWVGEVDEAGAFPELVAHAFHVATSERPGPVVVALPEDVLAEEAEVADAERYKAFRPRPAGAGVDRVHETLARAERPFVVVGGGGWTAQAAEDLQAWAEASELPVAASFRRQDYLDNTSRSYAGALTIGHSPALAARLRDADVLVALGTRLGEVPNRSYTTLEPPRTPHKLGHVRADRGELGRVFEPDVPVVADSTAFLARIKELPPLDGSARRAWAEEAPHAYLASLEPRPSTAPL